MVWILVRLKTLKQDASAQDTLEYLLTVGAVVTAVIVGLLGFDLLIQIFVGVVCPSVDTANPLVAIGSCITS